MQDLALGALHGALRGLSARQRVMADNVANVETPKFLASQVDFEDSLREAISRLIDVETRVAPVAEAPSDTETP